VGGAAWRIDRRAAHRQRCLRPRRHRAACPPGTASYCLRGAVSFPGGHQETGETLAEALVREVREEVRVMPATFRFLGTIDDPNTDDTDPATYHMYVVTAWDGGEPALVGDEHSELQWFTLDEAAVLPDLALAEYRALLVGALRAQ
jgi:ADP-ribose pyrophosphatase YjhB (NUDIX family)